MWRFTDLQTLRESLNVPLFRRLRGDPHLIDEIKICNQRTSLLLRNPSLIS